MRFHLVSSAAGLAIAALAPVVANAADFEYQPPLVVDSAFPEITEYQPIEFQTRWYIRGDLGVAADRIPHTIEYHPTGLKQTTGIAGLNVAMGYRFSDLIRGELEIGYNGIIDAEAEYGFRGNTQFGNATYACFGTDNSDPDNPVPNVPMDCSATDGYSRAYHWTGLANAYVDLATIRNITPYVGAGIGVSYVNTDWGIRFECDDDGAVECNSGDFSPGEAEREFALAWSVGGGASYAVDDRLSVDLGYRYLSLPGVEYVDIAEDGAEVKNSSIHQVRLGLRLDLH